jgi:hypothetical protein
MSLAIPSARGQVRQRTYSGRPSGTWGDTLTASATPHALPASPTQIIAATTYETEWIRIWIAETNATATNTDSLLNIYIGGAGSEVLFIDSLLAGWAGPVGGSRSPRSYWFPLRIPRGTRISGSLRALIASDTAEVGIELGVSNGEHWVGSGVETLGEDTAASEGTDITAGGAAEGTFTAIGTTGRRYRYIIPNAMGNTDTTLLDGATAWDIGVGSAVYQNMQDFVTMDSSVELNFNTLDHGFWCDIPSGTALQLRGQHAATAELTTVALYGCY